MKLHRVLSAMTLGAALAAPSCFFDADDDDDGDVDACFVDCDDAHTDCTASCNDDACVLDCDTEREDCETECE